MAAVTQTHEACLSPMGCEQVGEEKSVSTEEREGSRGLKQDRRVWGREGWGGSV